MAENSYASPLIRLARRASFWAPPLTRKYIQRTSITALCAALSSGSVWAAARLESFSPQGEVRAVRQVAARFNEPMQNAGDPSASAPFEIECAEGGQGRWVDERNWVFDFNRELPGGVACRFSLRAGLRSVAGEAIEPAPALEFSTGGPALLGSDPYSGDGGIEEEQMFILRFNTAVDLASLKGKAFCEAEGIGERIPLQLVEAATSKKLLAAMRLDDEFNSRHLVFKCQRRLPYGAKVLLVIEAGLRSASGIATRLPQTVEYRVRPDFIASLSCEREHAKADCLPVTPIRLQFSAPVPNHLASAVRLRSPKGKLVAPQKIKDDEAAVTALNFAAPFAESSSYRLELPNNLRDDSGRALANRARFPLLVKIAPYPPLAKFPGRFGIVETRAGALLPLTLRNIEAKLNLRQHQPTGPALASVSINSDSAILDWLHRLHRIDRDDRRGDSLLKGQSHVNTVTLPKPGGEKPFEVIGVPLKPGFHVLEIESPKLGRFLLGRERPMYVRAAALATNLAVHFKHGEQSSLVWVTSLDLGKPVAGATVAVRDCGGKLLWQGETSKAGTAPIKKDLPDAKTPCPDGGYGYFVSARSKTELGFVFSNWDQGIEAWRFDLPQDWRPSSLTIASVVDRSLLRGGDTLHLKHFARRPTATGFALPDRKQLPERVTLVHRGSDQRYEFSVKWDAKGIAEQSWRVPKDAKLGEYEVEFSRTKPNNDEVGEWISGRFRVAEFRLPLMRGVVSSPAQVQINPPTVPVDLALSYLSGGAARGSVVRLRAQLRPRRVHYSDYEDFSIGNGDFDEHGEPRALIEPKLIADIPEIRLDDGGNARVTVGGVGRLEGPAELFTEMEYRDAAGETHTIAGRTPLHVAALQVGVKGSVDTNKLLTIESLALDLAGKPLAGASLAVDVWSRRYLSHRKRLAGGFYSYEHHTEMKPLGVLCSGKSDYRGLLACTVKAPAAGELVLRAKATDKEQRASTAHGFVYLAGEDEYWGEMADHDRIDLIPDKRRYEPGETALLQVRSPFREATALVTIEREGVLESSVKTVSGKSPLVEVPIKGHYAPNAFVSVLLVRGRVAGVQPTALVDLGKPAYKLGIVELQVGWNEHQLKVEVAPDQSRYPTRGTAKVAVRVSDPSGKPPPKGAEVALVAIDEALLELAPNDSWDLLAAMMERRAYRVETATAHSQVVGKRHFGRKAIPSGGGGGQQPTRELFDSLLAWRGRVALDDAGRAEIAVPLNDSLSSFRIVAIASAGSALFGSGSVSIRTTRDLQILAGLPRQLRHGDLLHGLVTLRNASQERFSVRFAGTVKRISGERAEEIDRVDSQRDIDLAPGAAEEIVWPLQAPEDGDALVWELEARAAGARSDKLRFVQQLLPAVPVRVTQASLAQVDGDYRVPMAIPADALAQRGGVALSLSPKLAGSLDGVTRYMASYPYSCLEQRASRAVALNDESAWRELVDDLPTYLDGDGFAMYFPGSNTGSDALTAYLLAIGHAAGWSVPEASRRQMRDALVAFVEGRVTRQHWAPRRDLTVRKLAALEALSREIKLEPAWLDSIDPRPNDWPTAALVDWISLLTRSAHLARRDAQLAEAKTVLRARMSLQGSLLMFSNERDDAWYWLMGSADGTALRALDSMLSHPDWRGDIPRMARGAMARQLRGHWSTTTANAWGVLALRAFSKAYESETVSGVTSAALGANQTRLDWAKQPSGGELQLDWPPGAEDLQVRQEGAGKPWLLLQSRAAVPRQEPFGAGYRIERSVAPVHQRVPGKWSRGDVVRIRLDIDASADMSWVAVTDPIPAGANILGRGLLRDSALLNAGAGSSGSAWLAYQEPGATEMRAYYAFAPKGRFSLQYTLRLNNPGLFTLPPSRVEAMYAPEMFGEGAITEWQVRD